MNNFLIGMYGKFDEFKYKRDFESGFWGKSMYVSNEQEVDKLVSQTIKDGINFGVHYPLIKKDTPYRIHFAIALSADEREKSMG